MLDRISFAALAFAAALGATVSAAQAWDDTKYPDLKGQWVRGYQRASQTQGRFGLAALYRDSELEPWDCACGRLCGRTTRQRHGNFGR